MPGVEGQRVMIVEDNFLIAEIIVDSIMARGGIPLGPYATIDSAIMALDAEAADADVALLDVNLDGTSFAVADSLLERGIPFVFATGFASEIPPAYRGGVVCCKPYTPSSLVIAIAAALAPAHPHSEVA